MKNLASLAFEAYLVMRLICNDTSGFFIWGSQMEVEETVPHTAPKVPNRLACVFFPPKIKTNEITVKDVGKSVERYRVELNNMLLTRSILYGLVVSVAFRLGNSWEFGTQRSHSRL